MTFVVYKSSAGSGKTYTLVKEYLKIVLHKPEKFREILAITFTNKAANEMKERIIANLKKLASKENYNQNIPKKHLLKDIIQETGLNSDEIKKNAAKALFLVLHNYSEFSISTIDSFTHKIVKTFAYDLSLPLNFNVEMDSESILKEAIDKLISKTGIDLDLTELLIRFTELKAEDERDWNIENDLFSLSKTLIKEDSQKFVQRLRKFSYKDFQNFSKYLKNNILRFKEEISKHALKAAKLFSENHISPDSFYYGSKGIGNYFLKLCNPNNEEFKPNIRVLKTINEGIWYGTKIDQNERLAIEKIKDNLKIIFQNIQSILDIKLKKYQLYKIVLKQIFPIAVLTEIGKIIEEIKEQNSIVLISEFNKQISKIIANEPVPFIYERLGERYKHFLIDEFQDTSIMQWQNLIPLIDNSLSEGHFNLIVGDGKQAIYRWRNGEVEQFSYLPEIFMKEDMLLSKERESNLKRNYKEYVLRNNYRSSMEIVEFNNQFFKIISEKLSSHFKDVYNNVVQDFDEQNIGGYVHLEFVPKSQKTGEEPMLEKLGIFIENIIVSGRQYKDIAILCRTKKNAQRCSSYLMEKNIPLLSSESLLLSASPEINMIISFIYYLLNTDERIHLASVLQFLIEKKKIHEQNLAEIFMFFDKHSEEPNHIQKYFEKNGILFNVYNLLSLNVYDLLEEIIRIFELDKRVDTYLQFFLDMVLEFNLKGKFGIFDFINWWEKEKENVSVIVPEGINAIQILTIHKAKGLEFPIVIYPFADEHLKSGRSHLWLKIDDVDLPMLDVAYLPVQKILMETTYKHEYDYEMSKSLLDSINLLYVAFTRAKEQLYVLTDIPAQSEVIDIPYLIKFYLERIKLWDDAINVYTFGEILQPKHLNKQYVTNVVLNKLLSVNWRKNLSVKTSAPKVWDIENPEVNKQKGIFIHFLLSQIKTIDQIPKIIQQNIENGLIDNFEREKILVLLTKILSHPNIHPYFKDDLDVMIETDILFDLGMTIRPDRMILDNDKVIIIDYKTGNPKKIHEEQMNKYAQVLRQMQYKVQEKILIYVNEEVFVKKWNN